MDTDSSTTSSQHRSCLTRYPWHVLLMCCVLAFTAMGQAAGLGAIFTDVMDTFQVGQSSASLVQSLTYGVSLCAGLVTGPVLRRLGPRVTVVGGSVLSALGYVLAFLASHIALVIAGVGVLGGVGVSCYILTAQVVAGLQFHDIRSVTLPLITSCAALGTVAFPLMFRYLVQTYALRGTFLVLGAVNLQMTVCGVLVGMHRPSLPPPGQTKHLAEVEEGKGMKEEEEEDDSTTPLHGDRSKTYTTTADNNHTSPRATHEQGKNRLANLFSLLQLDVFRNRLFLAFSLTGLPPLMVFFMPLFFLTDMVRSSGLTVEQGSSLLSVMFTANMAGKVMTGPVHYAVKKRIPAVYGATLIACGVGCVLLTAVGRYPTYAVVVVVYGLSYGMLTAIMPLIVLEVLPHGQYAVGMGFVFFISGIFVSLGGPVGGAVRDVSGTYFPLWYLGLGTGVVSGGLLLLITLRPACARSAVTTPF